MAQIGDLEQLILEHVEGVETAVRTDISARLDTHEDLLNELGTEVDNLPRSAQEMVDELRQAATGVLDEQAAIAAQLEAAQSDADIEIKASCACARVAWEDGDDAHGAGSSAAAL